MITIVLVAAMLAAGLRRRTAAEPSEPPALKAATLVANRPTLALFHLMTGKLGLAQAKTGLMFPQASYVLALGTALGITGCLYLTLSPRANASDHRKLVFHRCDVPGWSSRALARPKRTGDGTG